MSLEVQKALSKHITHSDKSLKNHFDKFIENRILIYNNRRNHINGLGAIEGIEWSDHYSVEDAKTTIESLETIARKFI